MRNEMSDDMYCTRCGQELPEDSNFCYRCGNKIKDVKIIIKPVDNSKLENQIDFEKILSNSNVKKTEITSEKKIEKENSVKKIAPQNKIEEPTSVEIQKTPKKSKFSGFFKKKEIENKTDFLISDENISVDALSGGKVSKNSKNKKSSKKRDFGKTFKSFMHYMVEDELSDSDLENELKALEKNKALETPKKEEKNEIVEVKEKPKNEKSETKKESAFKKFKDFLYAKDEDDILDNFDELENKKSEKKIVKDSDISKENSNKEEFFENKNHTIKYSKTVIDSKLKEIAENSEFEDKNTDEKNNFENTLVFSDPEYKKKLNLEFEKVDENKKNPLKEIWISIKNVFLSIFDFFRSIPKFFKSNKKENKITKTEKSQNSNIDIILSSAENYNGDTIPLIMTEDEKNALNEAIKKESLKNGKNGFFETQNNKLKPSVKNLINKGPLIRIPMIILTFLSCYFDMNLIVANGGLKFFLSLAKLLTVYIIIGFTTNASYKALEIKLKNSVTSFFVIFQALIYKIIDSLILYFTAEKAKTIEALLEVFSPKFFSFFIIFFLSILMILLTYDKLKERNSVFLFLGWYIVISTALTLVIILINLLMITVVGTLFGNVLF